MTTHWDIDGTDFHIREVPGSVHAVDRVVYVVFRCMPVSGDMLHDDILFATPSWVKAVEMCNHFEERKNANAECSRDGSKSPD